MYVDKFWKKKKKYHVHAGKFVYITQNLPAYKKLTGVLKKKKLTTMQNLSAYCCNILVSFINTGKFC